MLLVKQTKICGSDHHRQTSFDILHEFSLSPSHSASRFSTLHQETADVGRRISATRKCSRNLFVILQMAGEYTIECLQSSRHSESLTCVNISSLAFGLFLSISSFQPPAFGTTDLRSSSGEWTWAHPDVTDADALSSEPVCSASGPYKSDLASDAATES